MEHRGLLVLCSETHTRHRNTLHEHNVGYLMLSLLLKAKVTLEQVMKAQRRNVRIVLLFL